MKPKTDKIIVVDVEATCWPAKTDPPPGESREIIEVGVAVIDTLKKEIRTFEGGSYIVKPIQSKVSEFCTELTGWTQELVDMGATFYDTCKCLERIYDTKTYTWASWGNFDKQIFTDQCKNQGVDYPFSWNHINAMNLAALKFGWKKGRGMMRALTALEIPHTGKHHNGGDDAFNIAKIICKILW